MHLSNTSAQRSRSKWKHVNGLPRVVYGHDRHARWSARPLAAPDAVDGGTCGSDVPYRLSPFAMLAATPKPQPEEVVAVSPL
jgi:hypothetical protein